MFKNYRLKIVYFWECIFKLCFFHLHLDNLFFWNFLRFIRFIISKIIIFRNYVFYLSAFLCFWSFSQIVQIQLGGTSFNSSKRFFSNVIHGFASAYYYLIKINFFANEEWSCFNKFFYVIISDLNSLWYLYLKDFIIPISFG